MWGKITISGGKSGLHVLAVILACFILHFSLIAQENRKAWGSLSRPEKRWTIFHPCKARVVYRCAQRARFVTDSLEKAEVLKDGNGGQLDAFRHAYWMALLVNEGLKEKAVRKVGLVHERGNYIDFKTGKQEDGARPDSMACVMDAKNNEVGISIGKQFMKGDKTTSLIRLIIMNVWEGNLFILSKDAHGNYWSCQHQLIDLTSCKDKWGIPKCLVKSNEIAEVH